MTTSIDIFNDIIKILDSIVLMEDSIGKTAQSGEKFIEDFKAGNLEQAQADSDDAVPIKSYCQEHYQ